LNQTHYILVYADDMNLLGNNIYTTNKNTKALTDARKEVGLEINVKKTKYMSLSRHQNANQNCDIKIANRLFENMSQFRYLGVTVTNQRRLNSGNACFHYVQNLLSSRLLSKNIKIRI
jgi:hypothetical protein